MGEKGGIISERSKNKKKELMKGVRVKKVHRTKEKVKTFKTSRKQWKARGRRKPGRDRATKSSKGGKSFDLPYLRSQRAGYKAANVRRWAHVSPRQLCQPEATSKPKASMVL